MAHSEENVIKGVYAAETISAEDTLTSGEFKKQIEQELKQNWIKKKMYGQFIRGMPENVYKNKTWQWLSKCDIKIGTEAQMCSTGTSHQDKLCKVLHR